MSRENKLKRGDGETWYRHSTQTKVGSTPKEVKTLYPDGQGNIVSTTGKTIGEFSRGAQPIK